MSFFNELKRRNVIRVGIAYVIVAWLVLQFADVVLNNIEAPHWVFQVIMLVLGIGLPVVLVFAWAFEMTPEGIKKEKDIDRSQSITPQTGQKLNYSIIALLVVGLGYFAWVAKFQHSPGAIPASAGTTNMRTVIPGENSVIPAQAGTSSTTQDVSAETSKQTALTDQSIAVLPFTNRSPNPDDAYFTDGIHDDLLTQLAKIKAFSVISRTSVLEYRDTAKNLKQIGKELGVSDIMEGSVQRAGDRVRINVQLINAATDKHLWAEIYDRKLTTDNLFDIQSEIAQAIATALHATLTDTEVASVADAPTSNVNAYQLYLQARRFTLGETRIGYQTAADLYREALALDPGFKLAWLGLAQAHITNYWVYGGKPADRDAARNAINKAKAIDADFPELYMAEGFYHYWGLLDYTTAIAYLDKAIALMPGNAEAYMWKGWAARRAGRWQEALAVMQTALKLNPRVLFNWVELGATREYQHDYVNARKAFERARSIDTDDFWAKTNLAELDVLQRGDLENALTLTLGAQHTSETDFIDTYMNIRVLAGHYQEALDTARKLPENLEMRREAIVLREDWQAQVLYFMGDKKAARQAARKALSRLQALRAELGDGYRIHLPEARMQSILDEPEKVLATVNQSLQANPPDAVQDFHFRYQYARCYAMAGLPADTIDMLEPLLTPPSNTSAAWVRLDPAFDGIREAPEFIAMLERHR